VLEVKENEYELYKLINSDNKSNLKQKEIKITVNKLIENIEALKINLNSKIVEHNDLKRKREDLQVTINKLAKEPLGASLNLSFQYYVVLLDNMTLEYNKNSNLINLKQKEIKLNKLLDQLKIRDDIITNVKSELNKNGVKINTNNNIKPIENLNIDHSFVLPVVIAPSNPFQKLPPNIKKSEQIVNNSSQVANRSPYEGYSNPNITKQKKKIKSKTTEIIIKAKRNQLTDVKMNMINNLYGSSKLYYINKNNPNKKINNKMQNVIPVDSRSFNRSYDKINTSLDKSQNSDISRRSTSKIREKIREREIDKKIKNIFINRNVLTRHKNSPYLKNFNNS